MILPRLATVILGVKFREAEFGEVKFLNSRSSSTWLSTVVEGLDAGGPPAVILQLRSYSISQ